MRAELTLDTLSDTWSSLGPHNHMDAKGSSLQEAWLDCLQGLWRTCALQNLCCDVTV